MPDEKNDETPRRLTLAERWAQEPPLGSDLPPVEFFYHVRSTLDIVVYKLFEDEDDRLEIRAMDAPSIQTFKQANPGLLNKPGFYSLFGDSHGQEAPERLKKAMKKQLGVDAPSS